MILDDNKRVVWPSQAEQVCRCYRARRPHYLKRTCGFLILKGQAARLKNLINRLKYFQNEEENEPDVLYVLRVASLATIFF